MIKNYELAALFIGYIVICVAIMVTNINLFMIGEGVIVTVLLIVLWRNKRLKKNCNEL